MCVEIIQTTYGSIPKKELVLPKIRGESKKFHNYLYKLYNEKVDKNSLPLTVNISGINILIVPKQFTRLKQTKLSNILFFRAGSAKRTKLPIELTPELAYFVG